MFILAWQRDRHALQGTDDLNFVLYLLFHLVCLRGKSSFITGLAA
jgi:hypothetical protein